MSDPVPQTRSEWLANEIADAIVRGDLSPGSRLDEQALAERYSVSRTPVREALRHLSASGLVSSQPRRGASVARVSPEQLEELFVAMGEMEATCARLAAMRMTPVERRRLEAQHEHMGLLAQHNKIAAYTEANVEFHTAIYAGAHNAVLGEHALMLRRRLAPFRRAQFRAKGRLKRSHAEHDLVVGAVLRGDAIAAHAAMLQHVSLVEDAVDSLSRPARKRPPRS
jgi:DNA-binding GntR family transcriptional regulator